MAAKVEKLRGKFLKNGHNLKNTNFSKGQLSPGVPYTFLESPGSPEAILAKKCFPQFFVSKNSILGPVKLLSNKCKLSSAIILLLKAIS